MAWLRLKNSRIVRVAVVATHLAWSSAASAAVFRGPEVSAAVRSSINTRESLLQLMLGQAFHNDLLNFVNVTSRWAPGEFELNTGAQVPGNLLRYQIGAGFGLGTPANYGVFGGMMFDGMSTPGLRGAAPGTLDQMMYIGFGIKGFQLALSGKVGTGTADVDAWDQFYREGSPDMYRRALPWKSDNDPRFEGDTWTLFHNDTGAYIAWTQDAGSGGSLRAHLQPLHRLLPDVFGLPRLGLAVLSEAQRRLQHKAAGSTREEPSGSGISLDLGTDDAIFGLRVAASAQFSPDVRLLRLEVGNVIPVGDPRLPRGVPGFGYRAIYTDIGGEKRLSADAFVAIGLFQERERRHDDPRRAPNPYKLQLAVSYSYDSPDVVTFFPIRNAHVVGMQIVWGEPQTARPIVPIVRAYQDDRGLGDSL